jgi:hypothetical protein
VTIREAARFTVLRLPELTRAEAGTSAA